MHSAAIQRMRSIKLPASSSAPQRMDGPPSSYAGSGLSLLPHGAKAAADPHSSVAVLER